MPHTWFLSVEYKGRWTCASYVVDVLKVDAKLRQSLREFLGMNKHIKKKSMFLDLLYILKMITAWSTSVESIIFQVFILEESGKIEQFILLILKLA